VLVRGTDDPAIATCGSSRPRGTKGARRSPTQAGAHRHPSCQGSTHLALFSRAVDRYCPAVVTGFLCFIGQCAPVPYPRKGIRAFGNLSPGLAFHDAHTQQVPPRRGRREKDWGARVGSWGQQWTRLPHCASLFAGDLPFAGQRPPLQYLLSAGRAEHFRILYRRRYWHDEAWPLPSSRKQSFFQRNPGGSTIRVLWVRDGLFCLCRR
jgi:hypothetical protein